MKSKSWSDDDFKDAVSRSTSIAGTLRRLGLKPVGGNYKTVNKYVAQLELDTSHWKGQGWLKGTSIRTSPRRDLEDILTRNSTYKNSSLRPRLIKAGLLEDRCSSCGITEWQEKPLTPHLDHINGINDDNRIENLRLLCPNCHSQTETYCGRNKGKK